MVDIRLLEEIKNYLDITWEMSDGELLKLSGIISRGMQLLEGKIGRCNFSEETQEKQLLFDYCMYARSGSASEFWIDYSGEIISLQMERWVEERA